MVGALIGSAPTGGADHDAKGVKVYLLLAPIGGLGQDGLRRGGSRQMSSTSCRGAAVSPFRVEMTLKSTFCLRCGVSAETALCCGDALFARLELRQV